MQTNPEEKRRQQLRKKLQKKRDAKYGPETGRPKEPWEIKKEALEKFKTTTVTGLADFIGSLSGMLDVMISSKPEQAFFLVGEFLERITSQINDEKLEEYTLPTYASQMRASGLLKDQNLPDTITIPRRDIESLLPLVRDFIKGPAASFLNTFEQYY